MPAAVRTLKPVPNPPGEHKPSSEHTTIESSAPPIASPEAPLTPRTCCRQFSSASSKVVKITTLLIITKLTFPRRDQCFSRSDAQPQSFARSVGLWKTLMRELWKAQPEVRKHNMPIASCRF